jgi:hypothetical protein
MAVFSMNGRSPAGAVSDASNEGLLPAWWQQAAVLAPDRAKAPGAASICANRPAKTFRPL